MKCSIYLDDMVIEIKDFYFKWQVYVKSAFKLIISVIIKHKESLK